MDMDGFDVEVELFAECSLSLLIYNEGRDNGDDQKKQDGLEIDCFRSGMEHCRFWFCEL